MSEAEQDSGVTARPAQGNSCGGKIQRNGGGSVSRSRAFRGHVPKHVRNPLQVDKG